MACPSLTAKRRMLSLAARFKVSSVAEHFPAVALDSHARPERTVRSANRQQGKMPATHAHRGTKHSRIGSDSQPECFRRGPFFIPGEPARGTWRSCNSDVVDLVVVYSAYLGIMETEMRLLNSIGAGE